MKEKIVSEKGIKVIDGIAYGIRGGVLGVTSGKEGYELFTVTVGSRTDNSRKRVTIHTHRLVAYQKYAEKIYDDGIMVRHKDGNKLNNLESNVLIGTNSDNQMDIPSGKRVARSIVAATKRRVLSDSEVESVRRMRILGSTYQELADEFNLSGKGHAHYIVNNNYVTVK